MATTELRELLRKHNINRGKKLGNDGFQFSFKGHRLELYPAREKNGKYTLAYNDDPPEADCWEFVDGTLSEIDQHLTEPEALWGW